MRGIAGLGAAGLVLVLAACGSGGDGPGTSPSPDAGTSTAPTATPSRTETILPTESPTASQVTCTPFGSLGQADSADPLVMSALTGAAMRVGRHDCYERFVFEMTGSGETPGWTVAYRDPMTGQGSGEPIDLLGEADLEIIVRVTTVPEFEGRPEEWPPFTGPDDLVTSGFLALREARNLFAYEGVTQIGLGVDQERPFRVSWEDAPPRLVVDIYTGQPLG